MRKAIRLNVVLWIEGEQEAAANFVKATTDAVRDIVASGRSSHPELRVTVKSIAEDESDDDDEEEGREGERAG
ncbi:MAG TPA: hypothetical protein VFQ38_03565 [Longimicrobiales bacterium]|nr:hypothetical protein [Longimicrobiales bacterium]